MLARLGVEFSANRGLGRLQLGMCACQLQGLVPRVPQATRAGPWRYEAAQG